MKTIVHIRGGELLRRALLDATPKIKRRIEQELKRMANEATKKTPAPAAKKKVILSPKERKKADKLAKKNAKQTAKIDKKIGKLRKEITKREQKILGLEKKRPK